MLVPTTMSTGTRSSRSTRKTPMWAKPRAPPPAAHAMAGARRRGAVGAGRWHAGAPNNALAA
jgi:hypothetical protein